MDSRESSGQTIRACLADQLAFVVCGDGVVGLAEDAQLALRADAVLLEEVLLRLRLLTGNEGA